MFSIRKWQFLGHILRKKMAWPSQDILKSKTYWSQEGHWKARHNLPNELLLMVDRIGIRRDNKMINFTNSFKGQNILVSNDWPHPERTRHMKKEDGSLTLCDSHSRRRKTLNSKPYRRHQETAPRSFPRNNGNSQIIRKGNLWRVYILTADGFKSHIKYNTPKTKEKK